jgi:hypothetical protein
MPSLPSWVVLIAAQHEVADGKFFDELASRRRPQRCLSGEADFQPRLECQPGQRIVQDRVAQWQSSRRDYGLAQSGSG